MLWTYLAVSLVSIYLHNITMARFNNLLQISLTQDGHPSDISPQPLTYTSAQLREIFGSMKRCVPNYTALRTIKSLKINKRRIRFQKHQRHSQKRANLSNLATLPHEPQQPILSSKFLCFGMVNARSMSSIDLIMELVLREDLDFIVITETWLKHDDDLWLHTQGLSDLGYCCDSVQRLDRRGGGLLLMYKKSLAVKRIQGYKFRFSEHALWNISVANMQINCLAVYHPPSTTIPNSMFIDCFLDDVEPLISRKSNVFIIGDFNIHANDITDDDAIFLKEAMLSLGFDQHVTSPTHIAGNTIDLIFTESYSKLKVQNCVTIDFVSDHRMVICQSKINKISVPKEIVSSRKLLPDGLSTLTTDYDDHDILCAKDLMSAVTEYHLHLSQLRDKIMPSVERKISVRRKTPWFNVYIHNQKKVVRNRERSWLKYGEQHQWEAYKRERNRLKNLINFSKRSITSANVSKAWGNIKNLYSVLNSITESKQENPLPPNTSDEDLCEEFAVYFLDKILNIRKLFDGIPPLDPPLSGVPTLRKFSVLTANEVKAIINSMKKKSSELDPLPTHIIKSNLDTFLPAITKIVNLSLNTGSFDITWKHAIVKPLLKKKGLELIHKNYRPVSNLQFLSKIVE